jgi:hypothetical protein
VRFQFPLYKLFIITAVYAMAFGAHSHLGIGGIIAAAVIGTAGSLIVLAIHDKKGIVSGVIVAVGSLIGVFFAGLLLPATMNRYTIGDYARDCSILAVGAIFGGLLFSWSSKR